MTAETLPGGVSVDFGHQSTPHSASGPRNADKRGQTSFIWWKSFEMWHWFAMPVWLGRTNWSMANANDNAGDRSGEQPALQDWQKIVDAPRTTHRERPGASVTAWTMIQDAQDASSPTTQLSRDQLMQRYWTTVFSFIRSTGRTVPQAEDLTQGFFCDVVIGRDLFGRADRTRGHFRSLLMSAVRNYMSDDYRMRSAKRRSPGAGKLSRLDDENTGLMPRSDLPTPEEAFNAHWAEELIQRTGNEVKATFIAEGKQMHWDILKRRILDPCLTGEAAVPHDELAQEWGLSGLPQVANLLVTAKRRFARALLDNVRATITDNHSPQTELTELFGALEQRS